MVSLDRIEDCWELETVEETYYLSDPRQITRVIGFGADMKGRVFRKYSYEGFVEVEQGDTVMDIGAFIGEFSRAAGEIADRIIAIEPDETNIRALKRNLQHLDSTEVIQKVAWNETGTKSFQVANDPSEGSILDIDKSEVSNVVTLDSIRIDDLMTDLGVQKVDFLKVEAEGVEPEVLEGVGEVSIPKIAVECAPEREGKSPKPEVEEWFKDNGYKTKAQGHIVFGSIES